MSWTEYGSPEARCAACRVCETSRVRVLPGEGHPDAEIAVIGEGPGEEEERHARNFVGRAGEMLNGILREKGVELLRAEIWIENSVKGRCTKVVMDERRNRKPEMREIDACRGYLVDSLARVRPRVIVAMGDVAITSLIGKQLGGVTAQRGRVIWSEEFNAWIVPTFHPAYALRWPAQRHFIVEDMKLAIRTRDLSRAGMHPAQTGPPTEVEVVRTIGDAEAARDAIRRFDRMVFDWETFGPVDDNGLHLISARGFCLSVATRERHAWVFPRFLQGLAPAWARADLHRLDDLLRDVLTFKSQEKGGFNVTAFDAPITMSTLGVWPVNVTSDTAIANHLVNAHLGERANALKIVAAMRTDMGRYDDELDQWLIAHKYTRDGTPDKSKLYLVDDEILHKYSGMDADASMRLWPILDAQMKDEGVWDIYQEQRIPIAREHGEIDRIGVRIHRDRLDEASTHLAAGIAMLEASINEIAGGDVNVNSHPQIAKLLFTDLDLPVLGRTETGQPATGEEYLLQIRDQHEIVDLILRHRVYSKIKGTYVDGKPDRYGRAKALKSAIDSDGYARMNTRVAGPETLRFATRKPFAIHTFPKNSPGLPSIRALVIPREGYRMICADYKQQEWAIAAILSKQRDMIEAILDRGEDVHELVTHQLGGVDKQDYLDPVAGVKVSGDDDGLLWKSEDAFKIYKKSRSQWKSTNFTILFLGGPSTLAKRLGCNHPRGSCDCEVKAANFISEYYERYDRIRWWQHTTIKFTHEHGYVRTPFGSYRKLPGIYAADRMTIREAERMACNAPIQMSGAHVMVRALLAIQSRFRREKPGAYTWARWRKGNPESWFPGRVITSIHDELLCEVRADLVEEGCAIVRECMEAAYPELDGRRLRIGLAVTDCWGG